MNKLIIIILFAYMHIFSVYSQIRMGKQAHFAAGFFISAVGTIESYNILKDTQLKPWQSRILSSLIGTGLGFAAGHTKEIYDKKHGRAYSKQDFYYTGKGSVYGTVTVNLLLWSSIPESHVPIEELWLLENKFVNNK